MIRYRKAAVAMALALASSAVSGDESRAPGLPISAPVKAVPSPEAPAAPPAGPVPVEPERPQPTLPGGKLPQYQLNHNLGANDSAEPLRDGRLRFLLALPTRSILVEAVITIDGRPFPSAREKRIEEILAALKAPPAPEAEPPAEAPEETEEAAANQSGDEQAEQPQSAAPATPRYTLASTPAEFVRRYVAATSREATPAEVRWLLARRIDGPVFLMLNDNFQRFRANQRPVFYVLDRDRDGAISPAELQQTVASFQECDLNRDGIIDYAEIAKAADDPRLAKSAAPPIGKLIYRPGDTASEGASPEQLASLENGNPDLTLTISFQTSDLSQSTIAITAAGAALQEAVTRAAVDGGAISLPLQDAILSFSAMQGEPSDQISLGAVNDGYPLLPVVDPNDDGRFTVRELRELTGRLQRFDRNGDGGLSADETPPTIRVCFGLGPLVHRELAGIRSVNPRSAAPAVEAPAWFVRMDRNKDNDLTRAEFPGTDDQYQSLDADQDGLVSGEEAAQFDSKTQPPP